ncbi:Hypothetical Protein SLY_0837 [Strawberry lethal yellows phytoplasma (CPA) str. NZSb11]|uniref:Uncharacterized protein n=1 Tax=Strawberry lethal yellows phytoplasma (CPA) str. NZSb11 TaxID=980422 RepID=R4RXW6_PHYAS|nr:Hypothetical Protein SLY_0837 [Strawberry lethal yellows phytoplasma (CPA) str. NZSb11]
MVKSLDTSKPLYDEIGTEYKFGRIKDDNMGGYFYYIREKREGYPLSIMSFSINDNSNNRENKEINCPKYFSTKKPPTLEEWKNNAILKPNEYTFLEIANIFSNLNTNKLNPTPITLYDENGDEFKLEKSINMYFIRRVIRRVKGTSAQYEVSFPYNSQHNQKVEVSKYFSTTNPPSSGINNNWRQQK